MERQWDLTRICGTSSLRRRHARRVLSRTVRGRGADRLEGRVTLHAGSVQKLLPLLQPQKLIFQVSKSSTNFYVDTRIQRDSFCLGPVWERGQRKRAAYKQNAAPTSLFAILRPHVETSAYSATCGSQTRVQRRPFGGLILCFWLKRIAYAETNMPLVLGIWRLRGFESSPVMFPSCRVRTLGW